jgi:hypothetical protein
MCIYSPQSTEKCNKRCGTRGLEKLIGRQLDSVGPEIDFNASPKPCLAHIHAAVLCLPGVERVHEHQLTSESASTEALILDANFTSDWKGICPLVPPTRASASDAVVVFPYEFRMHKQLRLR